MNCKASATASGLAFRRRLVTVRASIRVMTGADATVISLCGRHRGAAPSRKPSRSRAQTRGESRKRRKTVVRCRSASTRLSRATVWQAPPPIAKANFGADPETAARDQLHL